MQDLLGRTDVVAVPELTKLYPEKFPARVTVTLRDGRKLTATRHFPKGDPQEPLTPSEIEAKFLANAAARLSKAQAAEAVRLIRGLPGLKDLARLHALLAM